MTRIGAAGAVVAATGVLLSGCAATTPRDTGKTAATPTAAVAPAPPTTTTVPQYAQIGQPLRNGGITLTVTGARVAEFIEMNESNSRPGSGYAKYTKTKPEQGGKYVVVKTHVVNDAQTSLDLTCSLPVTTKLADDRDRNFDPIEDLYKLKGNPECNKLLQPGFESDMTWVYLVPATATVTRWGFQDTTDFSNLSAPFTVVQLTV